METNLLYIRPTRKLDLKIGIITTDFIDKLLKYFGSECTSKINGEITIFSYSKCSVENYETVINILFDNLNMTSLILFHQDAKYFTDNVIRRILDCKTLRTVQLNDIRNEAIELSMIQQKSYVKQWILDH